ncbi:MAG: FtsQ-type POTRA domain-containing protein [Candidatus Cloacimonetes bacterium]|nr:FtsQ-type POTRA domain-containing protein [Candidatus Cloacimonadota bacterium]MDD2506048.1 FtsQ-type POTRA domain-containing protein [Candidatus Cloacimonadota bacterium]MDD4147938.1 FtsQ-type POTRA domain-containing protein [Candidatus Cloacimonadota bacterium]MDD4559562.1 FtsQ-type POTRA domain-containing protein [Candidatus Cloacimonadota bacterium]
MKERKRRGNSRYYLYFSLCMLAVMAVGYGCWYALRHLPFFEVDQIIVEGNTAVPDSLIISQCESYVGMNLFRVPKKEIKNKLGKISRIKSLKVKRHLLSTIEIQINERKGILYVKSFEGDLYPIDTEAIVLERYGKVYQEDIPIYSSYYTDNQLKAGVKLAKPDLNRILKTHLMIMQQAPDYLPIISEYYMIDNTINIIDARYGTRIIPGETDFSDQLRRYQFVQDNGNISRRSVVDLRYDNQVVVKAGDK